MAETKFFFTVDTHGPGDHTITIMESPFVTGHDVPVLHETNINTHQVLDEIRRYFVKVDAGESPAPLVIEGEASKLEPVAPFQMMDVESYTRKDGGEVVLYSDGHGKWEVGSWNAEGESMWHLNGVTEGGVSDGFRTVGGTFIPYTEETARAEFERWRD
jgi:hypothetical protein